MATKKRTKKRRAVRESQSTRISRKKAAMRARASKKIARTRGKGRLRAQGAKEAVAAPQTAVIYEVIETEVYEPEEEESLGA